ncbi:MAG: NAD(P)H-dependent oxidoreductase [Hyphococcus sp.]
MAKKVLILQGHPDPRGGHLCHALADAYAAGARGTGADVRQVEVATLDFPLLRTKEDWDTGEAGAPEGIKPAIADCRWAEHLLIIYPLWMGTMPALLKAFMEQAFRPGVAFGESARDNANAFKPAFTGKSARVAITMGMPALAYRWFFGAHSLKSLEKNILHFAGVKPVRESLFGLVEAGSRDAMKKRIEAFTQTGARDAA